MRPRWCRTAYYASIILLLTSCLPQESKRLRDRREVFTGIKYLSSILRLNNYTKTGVKLGSCSAGVISVSKEGQRYKVRAVTARHCFSRNMDISGEMEKVARSTVQQILIKDGSIDISDEIEVTDIDYGVPGRDLAFFTYVTRHPPRPFKGVVRPRIGEKLYSMGFPLNSGTPNMTEGFYKGKPLIEEKGLPKSLKQDNIFLISMPIIPGMSGSPIYTRDGRLVGVVSASIYMFNSYSLGTFIIDEKALLTLGNN